MDGKELWAEALALAKPCVRLSALPSGRPPVGCFRGPALPGSPLAFEHQLSFDLSVLPDAQSSPSLSGTLTLHSGDDAEGEPSTVAILPGTFDFASRPSASEVTLTHAHLARKNDDGRRVEWAGLEASSVLLYAYPDRSLPTVSDLLQYGSPKLHAWLASFGWKPSDRYNGNLDKRTPLAAEYNAAWWKDVEGKREQPRTLWWLPKERTFAVVGGWLNYLADEEFPSREPLLTLFAGEEPRRHVFVVDGQLQTLDEIT
jgi:hypothetical protein